MGGGFWAFFWIAVILKIPIVMLLCIVWWAIKDPPVPVPQERGDGGNDRDPRSHPRIRPPHSPRRGPHSDPSPAAPARMRVARRGRRIPSGHS